MRSAKNDSPNLLFNKVPIDFDMLSSIMLKWVVSNVDCYFVIIE